jgi:hypothetical protein
MTRFLLLFLFSGLLTAANAQNFCKKASVYFDLNRSEVKPEMLRRIDSLFSTLNGQTVVAELYGYADSLASADYNQRLSGKRTAAVKAYITQKYPSAVRYTEMNLGEDKAGSGDPSRDRRVDLFLVPVSGDQLVLDTGNETVELPIDYFEPCGICSSRPTVEGIYTDAEAGAAGMRFETNDGDQLITAGTVNFNFNPCDPAKKTTNKRICMSVRTSSLDRDMKIWEPDTINGIIYWKESTIQPEFDAVNMRYRFCGPFWGPVNVDKRFPREPGGWIIFPFTQVKSTFYTAKMQRINVTPEDTIPYSRKDAQKTVVSVGKAGERLFFLKENLLVLTQLIDTTTPYNIEQVFRVPADYYEEFIFSDTVVKVRFGRKTKATQFGFYLADMNEFIPVTRSKNKRHYVTAKPITDCVPAIVKGTALYVLDTKQTVFKYRKHQQIYTARISKKKMQVFRREKAWIS